MFHAIYSRKSRLLPEVALLAVTAVMSQTAAAQSAPSVQDSAPPVATPPAEQAVAGANQANASAPQAGDIIVTAQRREQTALKTPLSLTALDDKLIEQKQVTGLVDLQFVSPGIRSGQQQGVNRVFIRGIGLSSFASGADSSVAFYTDGVYVGRPAAQLSSFFDIGRIEVLRGPQGALYGRNATGGAINLITNNPESDAGGYVNVSLGNYSLHQAEGALNLPLTGAGGDLNARVAFKLLDRNGYGYDFGTDHPVNDAKSQAVRATLRYNPSNDVDIRLIGEYNHEADNNNYATNFGAYPGYQLSGVVDFGGTQIAGQQDAATALRGNTNRRKGYAITLNGTVSLTDSLSMTSITGWRKFERHNDASSDGTTAGLGSTYYNEWSNQASQELVFNWDADRLQVTGGLSYYHENLRNLVLVPFIQLGIDYIQQGTLKIDAYSAYIQGTYSLLDALRLTVAGRYSSEKRKSTGTFTFGTVTPLNDGRKWNAFNPKFGLEYDVAPGVLVYASATNGFKSGTFNVGQVNPAINPEKIWAYEIGAKARMLNNAVDISAAAFRYDYKDLQVNKILGLATLTTNAATATNKGFEVSINARPVDGLTLNANYTYLDATFKDFTSVNPLFPNAPAENLNGKMLPGAPKHAVTLGGSYVVPVGSESSLTLSGDASYQSRIYFSEFNDKVLSQKGVTKLNASIKYSSGDDWSLTFWGKNLTDETIAGNKTLGIPLWGYPIYGNLEAPATYGATLAVNF
ncbi:TonB-dependent receptor [Sphingobium sp. TCM1]|uniref:TonB-dependent receptor n=1 Tax=Sphingobium sp. TCM1 TaxID=453246 RepID=UPI0007F3DF5D|nr:TonB-dependent receptor [Sphingobium sp. TCM1]OAN56182.1 hypothetical protein A7Q26_01870 [Sphingobium sp. TCM1]